MRTKNGKFHFNDLNFALRTTITKVINVVMKYENVCVYTNVSIVNGVLRIFPHSRIPQNKIIKLRSRTEIMLSVANKCNPARFDRRYMIMNVASKWGVT